MTMREAIHATIDDLPDDRLMALKYFSEYLQRPVTLGAEELEDLLDSIEFSIARKDQPKDDGLTLEQLDQELGLKSKRMNC